MHTIIISLGSNVHQEESITAISDYLIEYFDDIAFSTALWTEPIGIKSNKFLNRLAFIKTMKSYDTVCQIFEQIERATGSTHEKKREGIVKIDIDLLKFDDFIFHKEDWDREYITTLMKQNPHAAS